MAKASRYIKTTKGGTRVVRTIDVLRSEGGRKAIGALLETVTNSDAPSSNGASASNGTTTSANGSTRGATKSNEEAATTAEASVMRASSTTG